MIKETDGESEPYFDEEITKLINNIEVDEQNQPLKELVKKLIFNALREIEQKYGRDGEGVKPFHDASHTKEFIFDAANAFDTFSQTRPELNLTPRDKLLLLLASSYHDMEQNLKPPQNEQESANRLFADMETNPQIITSEKFLLKQLIPVTVFNFAKHKQSQSNFGAAENKTQALEQCMALADLAAVGDYDRQHWRGNRLAHELDKTGDPKAWFNLQINFLKNQNGYLKNSFGDFPVASLYPDIDRNINLYERLTRHFDELVDSGISPEQIMAKDKPTSQLIKQALDRI